MVEVAVIGRIEMMHATAEIPTYTWTIILIRTSATAGRTDLRTTLSTRKLIAGVGERKMLTRTVRVDAGRNTQHMTTAEPLQGKLMDAGDVSCSPSIGMMQTDSSKRTAVEAGKTRHTTEKSSIATTTKMTGAVGIRG